MTRKFITNTFLIAFLTLGFYATSFASQSEANVKVNGMVCAFCSSKLEKSFKERSEVAQVHVDLDNKNVHIMFKDSKTLSDEEIKKIITESGFTVKELTR
jgi:copper chaperone CopZ